MSKEPKNKFCSACPRKLNRPPSDPCPLALERINALQISDEEGKRRRETDNLPGCPWYVTSAEHGYCFWNLVDSPDGKIDPFPDKEICDLLMLSPAQVDKALNSALSKLRAIKDQPDMQEFKELIIDQIERQSDNTIYLPDEFASLAAASSEEPEQEEDYEIPEAKSKPKKKVQLYGLYSQKKLDELKAKKNEDKKE